MNLLKETLTELSSLNLSSTSVKWVGSLDGLYAISWDEFAAIADVEYDDSIQHGQESAKDLVVVGEDWWLERDKREGKEEWVYHALPVRSCSAKKFTNVLHRRIDWSNLADIQPQE